MNQSEEIYKEWHSKKVPLIERYKFCFFIKFPHYNNIIKTFADNYKKLGSFMSASALLKDCGLFEDAMACMGMAQNQDQALKLYETLPEERKNTSKMQCILGDLKRDVNYYLKAIELSNGKSLRAYNSLGSYYFRKKDY